MNYIKTFEDYGTLTHKDVNNGDYVILIPNVKLNVYDTPKEYTDFLNNNIGEIMTTYISDVIRIQYTDIPKNILSNFSWDRSNGYHITVPLSKVLEVSKNKKYLDAIIQAKKFNI